MEVPTSSKWLLNPMDRVSAILFGLIMALTFTCSIGITHSGPTEIRQLLIGAIGCNLAWGTCGCHNVSYRSSCAKEQKQNDT